MIRHLLRVTRWTPFLAMSSIAVSYVIFRLHAASGPAAAVQTMRVVTVLLALACCACVDDAAATTLAASPTRLCRRRALQAITTLGPSAALWGVAFAITGPRSTTGSGVVREALALLAFVCVTALVAQRLGLHEPGPVAGAVMALTALLLLDVPDSVALFTGPGDPRWAAAHQRWTALLAGLLMLGAGALRDPAARPLHRLAGASAGRAKPVSPLD